MKGDFGSGTENNIAAIIKKYNIRHFTVKEVMDTLENNAVDYIPSIYISNLIVPLLIWDSIREGTGIKIRLTSSYRDKVGNRKAKGVKHSLHSIAAAIDGEAVDGKSDWKIQLYIKTMNLVIVNFPGHASPITRKHLGIGYYEGFTHIDNRGSHRRRSPVTWNG